VIELENINKIYKLKKDNPTIALDNISLKLPSKGLIFLVGKSGSGKSTLLNLLGCLDKPTSGKITFNGKELNKLKGKKLDTYRNTYIGFVFQDYNLLEKFNVKKNLEIALALQRKKLETLSLEKILENVELNGLENRRVNELS
jgi:ABC-type lipoprotein export system ATPase subunit